MGRASSKVTSTQRSSFILRIIFQLILYKQSYTSLPLNAHHFPVVPSASVVVILFKATFGVPYQFVSFLLIVQQFGSSSLVSEPQFEVPLGLAHKNFDWFIDFFVHFIIFENQQNKMDSHKIEVDPNSYEWSQVDYQLQVSTGKSSIKIVNMFKFEEENHNTPLDYKPRVNAIVQTTDFSRQYVKKVVEKSIPLEDVIFYAGHLNIHRYSNQPTKMFTIMICKVALGKIGTTKDDVTLLDAIYIDPEDPSEAFQYNYFVRSHAQYEVQYEVSFTISDHKEFKLSDYECSNCQNRIPSVYCRTQKLYFCEECCREHHKAKLMQNHELERIDKINTLSLCKNHNMKYEHYCLKCEKYLCGVCIQKGQHHQSNEHPIKPIYYLYEEKRQNNDLLPRKNKEKLESLLITLQDKKNQLMNNYNDVKNFIVEEFEKAMASLENLMDEKMIKLTSDEIELRMMNDRIEWSKAFIKFQQKCLKPVCYFKAQQYFEQELTKNKVSDFESIFLTRADIAAEGQITVARKDVLDRSRKRVNHPANNIPNEQSIASSTPKARISHPCIDTIPIVNLLEKGSLA